MGMVPVTSVTEAEASAAANLDPSMCGSCQSQCPAKPLDQYVRVGLDPRLQTYDARVHTPPWMESLWRRAEFDNTSRQRSGVNEDF